MKRLLSSLFIASVAFGCSQDRISKIDTPGTTPEQEPSHSPPSMSHQRVASAEFSPDGRRVVTSSSDGTIRIWDLHPGASVPLDHQWDASDNMPVMGGDRFKELQDQIDALERRVHELESSLPRNP